MSERQLEELEAHVEPIRLLLIKVSHKCDHVINADASWHFQLRKLAFTIKNSSTIILPKWFVVLTDLDLNSRMMPRDVQTRWNSTFDMLNFAVEYREALNAITGDWDMKLRQYELSKEDWNIATQLRDVLKVNFIL